MLRSRPALAAETLFLRKQWALERARQMKPRPAADPLRLTLLRLARCCAWRAALTIVQPATLLRWPRNAFRLSWRWRSRPGRPRLPADLHRLLAAMAGANPTGGEERSAAELLLTLGIRVSPRTVRRYMNRPTGGGGTHGRGPGQRWAPFVRTHAQARVAWDFCVVVTAPLRRLYGFVALAVGSRRVLHVNATAHPTAAWTLPQCREILRAPHAARFVLHDRDSISPGWLDAAVPARGDRGLRTPVHAPLVNGCSGRSAGNAWSS